VPTYSNPADLISRGIEPTALSTSTLWWKDQKWFTQQPSDWPRTVLNITTDNLEVRNIHVAFLHSEDFTQRFSKLNRLIRVIAYCKRFVRICRNSKVNRQSATLSTQELDQALTCCVKIVQQESYAKELKELGEKQVVGANSVLQAFHPFIDNEVLIRVGGRLQHSTLPHQTRHQTILPANHHFQG